MTIKERWARWNRYIGEVRLYRFRGAGYVLVPGDWTPRFDPQGRIYMVIAPDAERPAQVHNTEKP